MKTLIVFYSFSGNTKKVSEALRGYLKEKGSEVIVRQLQPKREIKSFFKQCQLALFKRRAELQEFDFEVSEFDLICLGTPVWAFAPTPAVNTFLDKIRGVSDKSCIVFTTYGSGTGNEKCLSVMADTLKARGAGLIKKLSVQQSKSNDSGFIKELLNKLEI